MLQPAWPCKPHFGELCAERGLRVLSAADVELATVSGLRVFVYRDVPPSFHHGLFAAGKPPEVRSGKVCDFMRAPCTPPDPPPNQPGYSKPLNEWLTGAKHCADVPLLAKLLALAALPGVHTDDPAVAHLFVVPFLGGFVERVSPAMSQTLDREQRQGNGIVDRLVDHLPHFSNVTAARHLFLFTNSCGGCLRGPCHRCATWQMTRSERAGVELAATLGPSWPADQIPAAKKPPAGRHWMKQLIVPPNVMEAEFYPPKYVPLCGFEGTSRGGGGVARPCRPNSAKKELLAFYQGAHSFNGIRDAILRELSKVVFGSPPAVSRAPPSGGGSSRVDTCDCGVRPRCCVNASAGVAFFHTRSHWHPVTPLGFAATIDWMQRSRFCICPPGDVPYNKRLFTALLSGCVPVLFSFRSQVAPERNWWKPRKGPGQRDIDPFYEQIDYTALGVEVTVDDEKDLAGFIERLRDIPDAVVEAKQRAIERVRHLLVYDMTGKRDDAFSSMLRQLVGQLAALPAPASDGPDGGRTQLTPPPMEKVRAYAPAKP